MNIRCLIFGHKWVLETKVIDNDFERCKICGILRVKTPDGKRHKIIR
jgi:hypothetical protein